MKRAQVRLWDFPSAVILILVLLTASERLYDTHWAAGLGSAIILALIGAALGLALGISQFKREIVFWFSFGYSIPIVIIVLGWILYGGMAWMERVSDLSNRLANALVLFFTSHPVHDTVLFVVFMALVFWIIGLMAGYALTRFGNFIGAVVPAGLVLVIVQLYDTHSGGSETLLAVYIFLCLLELGRLTYLQRHLFWKEQHVSVLYEARTDLHITLAIAACAIVMVAWLAPTSAQSFANIKTAWENFSRPWRDAQENLGNAVAGLQGGVKAQPAVFYGDALALGSQAATGNTVYLHIQTPTATTTSTERYYWRVRSYNIFLNDQWYSENGSSMSFAAGQAPLSLADPEGLTGEFTFTVSSVDLAVLVTPARPVWVSFPSELFFFQTPQGKMDPIQFRTNPAVLAGEQYVVRANGYEPTIVQLRNAGETYPGWALAHYLQLPDSLSPEVVALAQRITARAKTPYDMALAITQYLRSAITYSNTVDNPPAGQDLLDWFLFDSKKGFCNYYATAEVILLRSVGIPARMVVGFAQGEFVPPNQYVVRQRDSHAWPEVYFPGIGWIEFEPTSNQAALVRPLGENLPSAGQAGTETPAGAAGQSVPGLATATPIGRTVTGSVSGTPVNWLLRLILVCILIAIILRINPFGTSDNGLEADRPARRRALPVRLKYFFENRALTPPGWLLHWAYLAELDPVERAFATVYQSLHWLGEKPHPAQTPAEAAAALTERLPDVSKEINSLLHEYQRQLYSQVHGYLPLARRAVKAIRREALRVAIQQRWRTFRGIFRPEHQ
jgi:transglutaminase-like putative cysteine protease